MVSHYHTPLFWFHRVLLPHWQKEGVEFVSLREYIDTTTPHGRFILTVFGTLAKLECESIPENYHEGIEITKVKGKYKDREPV